MVVNCLPLYEPPPFDENREKEQDVDSIDSSSCSPERLPSSETSPQRKFTLIKARSVETLDLVAAELELHDRDYEDYKSEGECFSRTVQAAPRKWSRMSASFSKNLRVMVHNVDEMPTSSDVPMISPESEGERRDGQSPLQGETEGVGEAGGPVGEAGGNDGEISEDGEKVMKEEDESARNKADSGAIVGKENGHYAGNGEKSEEVSYEGSEELVSGERGGDMVEPKPYPEVSLEISSDSTEPKPKQGAQSKKKKKKKMPLRGTKSSSPISELENGSEGENEQSLTVNYLDTNTMSTLKRSSGSVSFYYRTDALKSPTNTSVALETSMEESVEEFSEDSGLTKTMIVIETKGYFSDANATPSAPSPSALTLPPDSVVSVLTPSLLPVAPPTLDQEFLERSGWLNKLSHRKGMFGDKWQKRYFVLHRSWLYYFKKYGVSMYKYIRTYV